jgi:hypothetical protein
MKSFQSILILGMMLFASLSQGMEVRRVVESKPAGAPDSAYVIEKNYSDIYPGAKPAWGFDTTWLHFPYRAEALLWKELHLKKNAIVGILSFETSKFPLNRNWDVIFQKVLSLSPGMNYQQESTIGPRHFRVILSVNP